MKKPSYLEYHGMLSGYNYYFKRNPIYRFELYLRGITVSSIQMGTAENITREKRKAERFND